MIFLALLLSFFIGSIPFGVLIGKMRGVDVRSVGSGNIGATNVWRALGPKAGTAAFVLDVLKGVAGPLIARSLLPEGTPNREIYIALCGVFAVLGHNFSPFIGFKGGKGISTSLGALFGLMPIVGVFCMVLWAVVLGISKRVSVASMTAAVALPIFALIIKVPTASFVVALFLGVIAFLKHIPNLKRIMAGTEPKIGQKKPDGTAPANINRLGS